MQEVLVSKIFNYTSAPTKNVEGQFWFNPSTNVLSRFNGTIWKPITVSSDDVAVLTDGSKVSLTSYLNTQIAALAEGIDSKQDKLVFYHEETSTNQEASIQGANSFSIQNTVNGLILNGNSGGITIKNSRFNTGQGVISLEANSWKNSSDPILFDVDGYGVKISDALKIPEIKNKQNKLQTYSESDPSSGLSSAAITAEVGLSLDSKQIKIGGGIFNSETIIDGWSKGYAGTSKIKVNGSSISLQTTSSDYKGSSIELTENTLAINSDNGITGNILEKTISSSSVDTKIPTAKAVKDALDTKQDKLKYYTEVSGSTPSATISVKTIKLTGRVAEGNNTTASGTNSHAEGQGTTASSPYQHAQGKFNIEDANEKYADIIGNGSSTSARSNAATVSWEGISWSQTDVRAGGTDQDSATHSLVAKQNSTDETLNTTDKTITGSINELKTSVDNKQNSLQYYSEDTLKSVSKLSSNRLEVDCYDVSGNTYNPFILRNENGIAIGGSENYGGKGLLTNIGKGSINLETPGGTTVLNYESLKIEGNGESTFKALTHPSDSDFTSSKINISTINSYIYDVLLSLKDDKVNISSATVGSIMPSALTSTNAQTLICADAFAIKPTTKTLFGFNNSAYNISTNRYAGLFYLKNTDANSTGISINPDNIILSDYNNYSSSDEGTYFAATEIDKGRISLQKRTNGSSEFIDSGYINPDSIKLHNGKFGNAYDYTSDIIITASRDSSDAPNFHGIAYKGEDSTDAQWFIGRTVDGDNPVEGQPTVSKPYIKGFANAEFSEKVQATTIQAGKEVSSSSGVATLTENGINFNTPAGTAAYAYNGIEISNAFFKVVGGSSNSYVQIPDNNGSNFKIWKGTETEFKALTAVNSDTVYLRVQENNRIKATVGADTANLENITDSYTLSSTSLTSFITDTKYNNAQGSILITPSLTNSGALIFGENITDTSKGFPLYPDNIVSIPFKNITNFKVAGSINDSFNYIVSFDI